MVDIKTHSRPFSYSSVDAECSKDMDKNSVALLVKGNSHTDAGNGGCSAGGGDGQGIVKAR